MRDLATFPSAWWLMVSFSQGNLSVLAFYVEIITGSQEPADTTRHSQECQISLVSANDELSIQSIKWL